MPWPVDINGNRYSISDFSGFAYTVAFPNIINDINAVAVKATAQYVAFTQATALGPVVSVNGLTAAVSLGNANNRIINGDMRIAQRQTSLTFGAVSRYVCDRWIVTNGSAGNITVSQETSQDFAVDRVVTNFLRINAPSGNGDIEILYKIDDPRIFAGKRITLNFKAKGSAAFSIDRVRIQQNFGTGGSATVTIAQSGNLTVTQAWQKFQLSGSVPNLDGKTLGTGDPHLRLTITPRVSGLSNNAFILDITDIWIDESLTGQDANNGRFDEKPPSVEQALCERYYERVPIDAAVYASAAGQQIVLPVPFKTRKRSAPALTFAAAGTLTNATASLSASPGDLTGQGRVTLTAAAAGLVAISGAVVAADSEF